MRWNSKLPMARALGAVVIGGVVMTVPTGVSEATASTQVATAIQEAVDAEGGEHGPGHGYPGQHRRGAEGAAVADQLDIEVDTFRDAVRAVIEARQEAGAEKPEEMTAEEREAHRAEFISDVAAELEISAGTLEAAFDAVFEARLAQGMADGKLTEAEADAIREAKANGTLHELQQERQVEHLGDKLEWFLEARIIDDTQYAALQVELAQSDMEGFRKLMREYREASDFGDDGLRPRDGRGGPGHGPRHGGDSPDDKGISQ
jgi:transposase-like protein